MNAKLQSIFARCTECGDCKLLPAVPSREYPQVRHGTSMRSARRVVYELTTGKTLPRSKLVVMACRESHCVNFDHMQITTKAGVGKLAAKEGAYAARRGKVMLLSRARAKLTLEKAREIRMSDESKRVLAQRYGVSPSLIGNIRRGEAWREAANGASVFNWRPAA